MRRAFNYLFPHQLADLAALEKGLHVVAEVKSDNEFLARIFVCWEAGKMFSIQQLDLNLSQQDLKIG